MDPKMDTNMDCFSSLTSVFYMDVPFGSKIAHIYDQPSYGNTVMLKSRRLNTPGFLIHCFLADKNIVDAYVQ